MQEGLDILTGFEAISLKEMDSVKLMNRTDTKFTFNRSQFNEVMKLIMPHYRVLEIDGKRLSRYKTLYYDTPDYRLYARHHNGGLNRYKIRHRSYLESDIGFLEVKFKSNKGRTVKERIKKQDIPTKWENEAEAFLKDMLPFDPHSLKPVIWVNYSRITLVNKTTPERVTIDVDLAFEKEHEKKNLSNLVIAEVKQEKRGASPFIKAMKQFYIREGAISKYCLAIALTNNPVKRNNFKEKLLNLKHIIHDDIVAAIG
jgi:hypothetical protein